MQADFAFLKIWRCEVGICVEDVCKGSGSKMWLVALKKEGNTQRLKARLKRQSCQTHLVGTNSIAAIDKVKKLYQYHFRQ